ncbi:olfactory receptor 14A16-like [Tachyglossus aculeatus]|uniref:olfactory receptor 14A16-like n=1 Tax=Tachyglossus aculeatus TaxID=9261 RepID=UPI0018F4B20A|nr:olfactory receptor 14A16-like [Tachyglossus aculeatus]
MPGAEGWAKAVSTGLCHLFVVILFLSTSFFSHLKPPSDSTSTLDLLLSVFYAVVPHALNPLIYSLRNWDIYTALGRVLRWKFFTVIMDDGVCGKMAAALLPFGTLSAMAHTIATFSVPVWRSNVLPQFFCDIPQHISLAWPGGNLQEFVTKTVSVGLTFGYLFSIAVSYVYIFRAVLRMPDAEGRVKSFSTCLPHLAVVNLFVANGAFACLKPVSDSTSTLDLLMPVFYSRVPPVLNPLIYSLRNRDMKPALGRRISGKCL